MKQQHGVNIGAVKLSTSSWWPYWKWIRFILQTVGLYRSYVLLFKPKPRTSKNLYLRADLLPGTEPTVHKNS